MPPVLRSFAVFQDTPPAEDISAPEQHKSMLPLKPATRSSSSKSESSFYPDNPPITATDKENLHPVTGERAGLDTADKKRKDGSSILVTKLHNPHPRPLGVKKHKKELSIILKDEGSPAKKRKASTLAVGTGQKVLKAKATTVTKKDTKAPTKPRKATTTKRTTTRPLTLSILPKVVEEASAGDGSQEGGEVKPKKAIQSQLSQADIDSRCYELTVKPLADVSQAYDDTFDVVPVDGKPKFQSVKESSIEPDIRDYFAPPIAGSACLQLGSSRKSPFEEPTGSTKTFSTPERKAIYAAFTFSSPSPSGERFSKTTRAGSIPRLELA